METIVKPVPNAALYLWNDDGKPTRMMGTRLPDGQVISETFLVTLEFQTLNEANEFISQMGGK